MIANILLTVLIGFTIMRLASMIVNRPGSNVGSQFVDVPLYSAWCIYGIVQFFT